MNATKNQLFDLPSPSLTTSQVQTLINSSTVGVTKWQKFTVTYGQLAAAALTNTITIYSLPAGATVNGCIIHHTAAFTGGLVATYTLSVGKTGNTTKYISAQNVFQAPSNTTFGIGSAGTIDLTDFGSTTNITLTAISTVGNLNTATKGSVDIYLLVSQLP